MREDRDIVEKLEALVSGIAGAEGPPDVFRALMEGAFLSAPRSIAFLVRKGILKGWLCAGYTAEITQRIRALEIPAGEGWPGRLADPGQPAMAVRGGDDQENSLEIGHPASDECIAHAVRIKGKTLAIFLLERNTDEEPWLPGALSLLVDTAELRLELDLARRRLSRVKPDAEPEPVRETPAAGEPEGESGEATGLSAELTSTHPGIGESEDPARSAARRFARLVATDIRLYNEESVILGRQNRDLANRLREQLARGRETFVRRFPDLGDDGDRILQEAFVQVLAAGDNALFVSD